MRTGTATPIQVCESLPGPILEGQGSRADAPASVTPESHSEITGSSRREWEGRQPGEPVQYPLHRAEAWGQVSDILKVTAS